MLRHFRNKTIRNNIFIGLAVIIILGLALPLFILDKPEGNAATAAGTLRGKRVSAQDLLESYNAARHQAQFVYGDQFAQIMPYLDFRRESWDRLLLLDYAKRERIRIPDAEVVKWIGDQQIFNRDGRFDTRFYKEYVERYLRSTPRRFEEEIRELLMLSKVSDRVRADIRVTDEEIRAQYQSENGTKDIRYGFLPSDKFVSGVKVDDAEIEKVFPMIKDQLTSSERVKLSFLLIPSGNAEAMKTATDEKISMEDAAKKTGIALQETGFFSKKDAVAGIGPQPKVLQEAFRLKEGGESGWIHTDTGSYKLRVTAKEASRPLTLEESKDNIRKLLLREEALNAAFKKAQDLKSKLNQDTFDQTLETEGIASRSLTGVRSANDIPEAMGGEAAADKLLSTLKEGEISEPIRVPSGILIINAVKLRPADPAGFEAAKEGQKNKLVDQKAGEELKKLLETLRKDLKENTELMDSIFEKKTPGVSSNPS